MKIQLNSIIKRNNLIKFQFSVSDDLKKYFSGKDCMIEYPESIESVPDSVLAVPFVCNVLPIIWLTNSVLEIDELDKSFYESISEFKKGYIKMFPEASFQGEICVKKLIDNSYDDTGKSAMFYSGGLDSAQTLISHIDEKPVLLSIWGSDIKFDNESGWNLVYTAIEEASSKFHLKEAVFHSSFREFDNEGELDRDFRKCLGDGWWHGVKHGIGLLGHVAPYAYLHKISKMYIASSNCPEDGQVKCASNPIIDNYVRFSGCKVIHDGFQFNRQDKTRNIVDFCKNNNEKITLHVCWQSQSGSNCCACEKCLRTIAALLSEGAEPSDYGFNEVDENIFNMQKCIVDVRNDAAIWKHWPHIARRAIINKNVVKKSKYWRDFKWVLSADFEHPESLQMSFFDRLRRKVSRTLHKIKG